MIEFPDYVDANELGRPARPNEKSNQGKDQTGKEPALACQKGETSNGWLY